MAAFTWQSFFHSLWLYVTFLKPFLLSVTNSEKHVSALLKLKTNISKADRKIVKTTLSDTLKESRADPGTRKFFSKVKVRWAAHLLLRVSLTESLVAEQQYYCVLYCVTVYLCKDIQSECQGKTFRCYLDWNPYYTQTRWWWMLAVVTVCYCIHKLDFTFMLAIFVHFIETVNKYARVCFYTLTNRSVPFYYMSFCLKTTMILKSSFFISCILCYIVLQRIIHVSCT